MKIKIKKNLDEISSVAGGSLAIAGGPLQTSRDIDSTNKKKDENQQPEDSKIEELFSTSATTGGIRQQDISADDEFEGFRERAAQQGLQNVKQVEKNKCLKVKIKRNLRK
jgi:hypothetical protein